METVQEVPAVEAPVAAPDWELKCEPRVPGQITGCVATSLVREKVLSLKLRAAIHHPDTGGINLLVFSLDSDPLTVIPVQVVGSSAESWWVKREWFKTQGVVVVHVYQAPGWTRPRFFIYGSLTDLEKAADRPWSENGDIRLRPTEDLLGRLAPYENNWDALLSAVQR